MRSDSLFVLVFLCGLNETELTWKLTYNYPTNAAHLHRGLTAFLLMVLRIRGTWLAPQYQKITFTENEKRLRV